MSTSKNTNWFIAGLSPITLGIISSAIYDYIKAKPILSSLFSILKYIWNFFTSILTANLKVWWVIVVFIIYLVIKAFFKKKLIEKKPEPPVFINYTNGRFQNWIWKWKWLWNTHEKQ